MGHCTMTQQYHIYLAVFDDPFVLFKLRGSEFHLQRIV